ncbi:MAG TPA: ABC transporter substrate-binding protein [Dehalococcoidia bacterium]|nr:ABC transporter substrate-binding protein [Dehalococcoidia bacterium]
MATSYWDKFTELRVSRRRLLQGAGVAGATASAVWIVGCGTSSAATGTATPASGTPSAGGGAATGGLKYLNTGGTPKSGGTLNIGTSVDFDTFDPYLSIAGGPTYFPRLYNAIINRSPRDSSFRFDDLASSVEQPDDVTYIFTMRDNVMIGPNQAGVPERPLDAMDAQTSFERIKQLKTSNAYAFVGTWVRSIAASADNKTLTIKTPQPYGYFFFRIGSPINLIVPRELSDQPDKLKSSSAGGGPYVLNPGQYTEGQSATFAKNSKYYRRDSNNKNAQLPYIDGMNIKIISDQASLRTAFQSGQIDSYPAQDVNDAKSLGSSFPTDKEPTDSFISVTMNPAKDPWKDERMRNAAMYALDRSVYVQRVYSGEAQANGIVHWSLGDYALPPSELEKLQPYDPKKSKQLINAATGQDTASVEVIWPADSIIEQHNLHLPIWLSQMKDAGFDIQKKPQAFATWLDNYTNMRYAMSLALNQVYETAEFEMDFESKEGPAGNGTYAVGLGSMFPEIEQGIAQSKAITDTTQQAAKVRDVQRLIYSKGPMFLPICTPYAFTLYQSYVKNIPVNIGTSGLFLNTWWLDK